MNALRVRIGETVAGAGALLLTVMLFLDWAQPEMRVRTAPGVDLSTPLQGMADDVFEKFAQTYAQTGWGAIGWLLVVILLVSIVGAFTLLALTLTERETPVLPVVTSVFITVWSIVAALVLFVRLTLLQPGLEIGWGDREVNILGPAWFGLLGLVAIAAGGWLTLRDDRLDSPQSVAPEVPMRPAPPATA